MDDRTDEELLAAVPRDAGALGELYDRHVQRVLGFALRRMDTPEEVADLVADVFLEVIQAAPRFDPGRGRALPWLYGVAANLGRQPQARAGPPGRRRTAPERPAAAGP